MVVFEQGSGNCTNGQHTNTKKIMGKFAKDHVHYFTDNTVGVRMDVAGVLVRISLSDVHIKEDGDVITIKQKRVGYYHGKPFVRRKVVRCL